LTFPVVASGLGIIHSVTALTLLCNSSYITRTP
jgi:hypothetical protein